MASLKYWVWLSTLGGIRRATLKKLIDEFGSPDKVYFAREHEYERLGILKGEIERLKNKSISAAKKTIDICNENNFRILTISDAEYPERLKNIFDPPIVLYVKGTLPSIDDEAAIGMVGTRKCTSYGLKAAEKIGYDIARAGGMVVTGLARGIDSAAAKGALRAGGKVVGVIGSGLDIVYPPENGTLFKNVSDMGAIISEYAPGTPPNGRNFPVRNRIISGISVGVAIIEAPERSGALITAASALEQGRDVFVVPGNIDAEACMGSNRLLREGAVPITSGWDIIDEYTAVFPEKLGYARVNDAAESAMSDAEIDLTFMEKEDKNSENITVNTKKVIDKAESMEYIDLIDDKCDYTDEEIRIITAIDGKTMHIDEIIEKTELSASSVLSALTMLEIRGIVSQKSGKHFMLNVTLK